MLTAIADLQAARKIEPTDTTANRILIQLTGQRAAIESQQGRNQLAIQYVKQAISDARAYAKLNVAGATPYRFEAQMYQMGAGLTKSRNELDQAANAYISAIEHSPYSLKDYLKLADIYWQQGEYQKASLIYKKALKISEDFYLDPGKQLLPEEKSLAIQRIEKAASPKP